MSPGIEHSILMLDPSLIESIQSSSWTVRCVLTCDGPIALGILLSLAFIGHLNGCLLNIRAAVLQYGTGDIKYGHSLALVIAAAFILQLLTGFIITSLVVLNLDLSFSALVYLASHNCYVFMLKTSHDWRLMSALSCCTLTSSREFPTSHLSLSSSQHMLPALRCSLKVHIVLTNKVSVPSS